MFDTVAFSESTFRSLDIGRLVEMGASVRHNSFTGEPFRLILNGEKGAGEPRITITKSPTDHWIIRPEVSIGRWLKGSNLYLPTESDLDIFCERLDEYVEQRTGFPFDVPNARVCRLDVSHDFAVEEGRIIPIIAEATHIRIAKYNTFGINQSTVRWDTKGNLNKRYQLYGKARQTADEHRPQDEIELARNRLRLEIQHRNNKSVRDLADSLKLPSHQAKHVLTIATAERTLDKAVKRLHLQPLLDKTQSNIEILFRDYKRRMAERLISHLVLKSHFGPHYNRLPFIDSADKSLKGYDKMCAESGVLALE